LLQTCVMNDLDTPRHHRKRQDLKKQKRPGRQRCNWALWVPVSILVLVAICVYLKDHPSDVAHWGHTSAVKTSDKNLTHYYKVRLLCATFLALHASTPQPACSLRQWCVHNPLPVLTKQARAGSYCIYCTPVSTSRPKLSRSFSSWLQGCSIVSQGQLPYSPSSRIVITC